jgi:hypothetical protein
MRTRIWLSLIVWLASGMAQGAEPSLGMMELELNGRRLEGAPLVWSDKEANLLGRDGRLTNFAPKDATNVRKLSTSFRGYSAVEMRDRLRQELGNRFEISGTGHYLVAHPPGQRDYWSKRFEDLYRSFVHYFALRGFTVREPEFPLVAIVWPNQQDFLRYAAQDGARISSNVLGYYSPVSNRITLFDVGGGNASDKSWSQNADTIIHEATHQTAFNTGVHRRFSATPRWLAEGLGTMFEAPGVWNSKQFPKREDRINRGRLSQFKQMVKGFRPGFVSGLVSSDRLFEANAAAAYAQAWALSFYLIETQPVKYADYLKLTARRPVFQDYPAGQRVADFTSIFGDDWQMFEARFLRFMQEIK